MNRSDLSLITVVCQGNLRPESKEVIENYLNVGLNVIYSGWASNPCPVAHENLICYYSNPPCNPGTGNVNMQITSSRKGVENSKTKYTWKVRSDQIYPIESILRYLEFFLKHKERDKKIFTPGLYSKEVLMFRDHQLLGLNSKIKQFWSCDLNPYSGPANYNVAIRAEVHLIANYLALYESEIMAMKLNYKDYFLDKSPKRHEAVRLTNEIMPKYFVAMPRVDFCWPKHNRIHSNGYNYEYCSRTYGEY